MAIERRLLQLDNKSRFQSKEVRFDNISYLYPTWDEMGIASFDLAKDIIRSGKKFDIMVALAKGGLTWARTLADNLQIDNLETVRIKKYFGVNQSEEPTIIQPLSRPVNGLNILLFDEVIDSGETVEKAQFYLDVMGAKSILVSTLCLKPVSKVMPDYYAFSTSAWVIFPHEIREFIKESTSKWINNGLSSSEVRQRFLEIGLPTEQVDFFMNLNSSPLDIQPSFREY